MLVEEEMAVRSCLTGFVLRVRTTFWLDDHRGSERNAESLKKPGGANHESRPLASFQSSSDPSVSMTTATIYLHDNRTWAKQWLNTFSRARQLLFGRFEHFETVSATFWLARAARRGRRRHDRRAQ